MKSPPLRRLANGDVSVLHYASYLRETYFYTREDPQIQAACTAYLRGPDRELVKLFLQHAISEVGHDAMALSDLAALGFDTETLPSQNPLAETTALISFPFYAMQFRSAHSYLGYLYFLEFLPTSQGSGILDSLRALGVPNGALTFLHEHNTVDVHHNKLMMRYASQMLRDDAAIDEVVYAMSTTAVLYAHMLAGAFQSVDDGAFQLRRLVGQTA